MKKKLFLGALLGTALLAFAAKDPVIMKINGKDVKLSEFEYLYQKNNKQQIEKESLEQYVERFVIYKLKVNEAEEMQLDTMQSFIKEFNGYKNDLAKPYLEDSTLTNRLAQECYQRMLRNVDVSNIFLSEGYDEVDQAAKKQKIDSLYQCLKNGEDIEELAFKHSEDRNAKRLKGKMGYIRVGLLPYEFERIAFSTPVGQFSEPFHTMYGWHILKVNGERADDGKVLAEHILKLYPKDADDSAKAEVLNSMKEIHKRAVAGENFEELAIKESQDPGSAKNGGKLRLFGRGEMVPQFEKVAYELKDGEISEPFETQYGVHIIKKIMSKPVGTYQENAEAIKAMIERDERGTMAANAKLDNIKVKYGFKENPELENYIKSQIKDAAGNDSLFVESLKKSNFVIFSLGKEQVTMSEATQSMKPRKTTSPKGEMLMAKAAVADKAKKVLTDKYINEIYETEPNFHNLINEYHDGMLLFEISNRKIWEGAAKDQKGLEKYFNDHRDQYTWTAPKFKGLIILAANDTVMNDVKQFLTEQANNPDKYAELKKKFNKQVSTERVLAAKGENQIVDYLVNNSGIKPVNKRFNTFWVAEGSTIDAPQDYTDVKVQVVSDYQAFLEKEWISELKQKYQVKINQKVLKQVKE